MSSDLELIKTIEICTKLCVKDITTNKLNIAQQSCLDRCDFKFKEAIQHTKSVIKFQNLEINKHIKTQKEIEANQEAGGMFGFLSKPPPKK